MVVENANKQSFVVTVGAKRTLEYVADCLVRFNRGITELTLKSLGKNISKGVEVSQILKEYFDVQIVSTNIGQTAEGGSNKAGALSFIQVGLRCENEPGGKADYTLGPESYIEFPVYHLLLDLVLAKERRLDIVANVRTEHTAASVHKPSSQATRVETRVLVISSRDGGFKWTADEALLQLVRRKAGKEREILGDLAGALYRCGLLLSDDWEETARELSKFDDIVLGVDTNLLYDCVITQQLLDGFALTSHRSYFYTPNWLLIVIPSAVMHELEQSANSRDQYGSLTFEGRKGYRALQEIIELDQSKDLMGVSLLIAGEANPILDTREELRGLRKEYVGLEKRPKLSAGDTIIRDQFKNFLRQVDFHKGAYFITGDKTNAALAQAEGLHSLYYKLAPWYDLIQQKGEGGASALISVPFGKLIYELVVQYGHIRVGWSTNEISLECDSKGEDLDHWLNRDLQIADRRDLGKLLQVYDISGKFYLSKVCRAWEELK